MIFSSLTYILFLAIVVLLYWHVAQRFKVPLLLIASYVFYMSWSPPYGLIYGPVIFLDTLYFYGLSLAMVKWPKHKKNILVFGIVTELGLLAYFKYANFFASTLQSLLKLINLPYTHTEFDIFLPLAISFTNFILISYLIDVYRGDEKPHKSFVNFATYVAFFPHLIAGPIVRAKELLHQFDRSPPFLVKNLVDGIHKFALGYFLKVFVADIIAVYVNQIYGNPDVQAFNTSWVASYGFSIQLFCDFFGYTLMAQGSAIMMGYTLPDNFNAPHFAKNISEYWRRWHISLSRWLKDYLFIPLGGSRGSRLMTYRNLFITMALGGLWHGANWTFVIWGLLQGILLSIYTTGKTLNLNRFIPTPVAILITFHSLCLVRVFFRCQTVNEALHMLGTMFNPFTSVELVQRGVSSLESAPEFMSTETAFLIIMLFFGTYAFIRKFGNRIQNAILREASIAMAYSVLLYFVMTMSGSQPSSFIYFQF